MPGFIIEILLGSNIRYLDWHSLCQSLPLKNLYREPFFTYLFMASFSSTGRTRTFRFVTQRTKTMIFQRKEISMHHFRGRDIGRKHLSWKFGALVSFIHETDLPQKKVLYQSLRSCHGKLKTVKATAYFNNLHSQSLDQIRSRINSACRRFRW